MMTFAAETMVGLRENLKDAINSLTTSDHALVTSISSGCELFLRFITLTALDNPVGSLHFSYGSSEVGAPLRNLGKFVYPTLPVSFG